MTSRTPLLLLLPLVVAATLATSGCSQITNTLEKVHEESFADMAAAKAGWKGVGAPDWLPADATDIHNLATTNESNSVILVTSASALPSTCAEADRKAIPFDSPDWAPKFDAFPDRVERCGDYEVLKTDHGWFGWFSATTEGRTPTPAAS